MHSFGSIKNNFPGTGSAEKALSVFCPFAGFLYMVTLLHGYNLIVYSNKGNAPAEQAPEGIFIQPFHL